MDMPAPDEASPTTSATQRAMPSSTVNLPSSEVSEGVDPVLPKRRAAGFSGLRPEPVLTVLTLALILLAWYAIARFRLVSELFVPHPMSVWQAFVDIATEGYRGGTLLHHLLDSLYRVLAGFTLAVVT